VVRLGTGRGRGRQASAGTAAVTNAFARWWPPRAVRRRGGAGAGTVGTRWVALPMLPLAGSVVAALAATASLSFGGAAARLVRGLAVAAALVVFAVWVLRPDLGPWTGPPARWKGQLRQRRSAPSGSSASWGPARGRCGVCGRPPWASTPVPCG